MSLTEVHFPDTNVHFPDARSAPPGFILHDAPITDPRMRLPPAFALPLLITAPLIGSAAIPAVLHSQQIPPATYCQDSAASTAAALDCMRLIPVPTLPAASGTVAVHQSPSPFDVAVGADGSPRYRLSATIAGLPDPRSLGDFSTYVAWAYTLTLDSATKLGSVSNGRVDLGEVRFVQFRIIISAERSPDVAEREGRLVLRGTSPSAHVLAHRDFLQPSAPGTATAASATTPSAAPATPDHSMAHGTHAASGSAWPMPPHPPWLRPMPGMSSLEPSVKPFLPGTTPASHTSSPSHSPSRFSPPKARPRELLRLSSRDTLALEAGLVTRTFAGRTFTMYGFNGQYPGPLIEVSQGATITVRFHNALDMPSSVHWHGLRLDNGSDGAPGVTQEAVPPGGDFTYTVHFPDAGIYWYHPHVREDIQQNLGLYGNMLVRSPLPGHDNPVNREQVLMLGDLLLGPDGLTPFGEESPTHALMGRFGNVLLVNGEPHYSLDVKRGEIVRFYFTNASNSRIYNVSFPDARMKVIASDVGKFEREEWVESVVIAPAQRYVVEVEFVREGSVPLVNRVIALDHGIGSYFAEVDTLGTVNVDRAPAPTLHTRAFEKLRTNAEVAADIAPFRRYFAKEPDHALVLSLRTRDLPPAVQGMLLGLNSPVEWNDGMPMMNWATTGNEITWVLRDPVTGKENMDIDWRFRQGDVVKLRFVNDPSTSHAMAHPIHLHGQRFLVLSRDGVPNENLVWKDTALIPAGETVDILVDMSNPGKWMLHCHIAEHLGAGMHTVVTVTPNAAGR